jgi:hypothetical protein
MKVMNEKNDQKTSNRKKNFKKEGDYELMKDFSNFHRMNKWLGSVDGWNRVKEADSKVLT